MVPASFKSGVARVPCRRTVGLLEFDFQNTQHIWVRKRSSYCTKTWGNGILQVRKLGEMVSYSFQTAAWYKNSCLQSFELQIIMKTVLNSRLNTDIFNMTEPKTPNLNPFTLMNIEAE